MNLVDAMVTGVTSTLRACGTNARWLSDQAGRRFRDWSEAGMNHEILRRQREASARLDAAILGLEDD